MKRITSANAYNEIKNNGLLSKRRFEVYELIYLHGTLTISQIIKLGSQKVVNSGSLAGRTSELERMGVIGVRKVAPCPITKKMAIHWAVTDNLPTKV